MLLSEAAGSGWKARALSAGLALFLLAGCQAQPLYGSINGETQSVSVSPADTRVEQAVRNELVLGIWRRADERGPYQLDLSVSSNIVGLLPGGHRQ